VEQVLAVTEPASAPAAHLMTVRGAPEGGGVLVGHLRCEGPETYVPNMPGQEYALVIDQIQAIVHHECPPGTGDNVGDVTIGVV